MPIVFAAGAGVTTVAPDTCCGGAPASVAVLELAKEQLLDIVQEEPLAPIYVKSLAAGNTNAPLQFSSEFDDNDAANANE